MPERDDSTDRKTRAMERKRAASRARHARLFAEDPEYHKKRYQRDKQRNPNLNREKYKRALQRDPDYNKKKRERLEEKRKAGLLPPKKNYTSRKHYKYCPLREREKYLQNKEQIIGRIVRRQKERYATDNRYAIYQGLRSRMRYAVKSQSARRSRRTIELLGCTAEELAKHLESQFEEGMSWSNRSEWHIDHIIPVAVFDLNTDEGQRAAFHYTNLRPLWAQDNRKKSAKPPVNQKRFSFGYVVVADERRARTRKGGSR